MVYYVSRSGRFFLQLFWLTLALAFFWSMPVQAQQVVLGTTRIQNSLDSNPIGVAEAFPVWANSSNKISFLSVFIDSANTAGAIRVGLYSNYYDHPGTLLAQEPILNPVPGQWNTVPIPPTQVNKWKRYWIALLGLSGQIEFRDTNGNCYSETSLQNTLSFLPRTWSTGSRYSTCIASVFGSTGSGRAVSLSVSPTSTSLTIGQQKQFTASVSGTSNTGVTWSSTGGSVSSTGLYTAPSSAGTYTVTATSVADSTKSASATVSVTAPVIVSVSVSPTSASLQTGAQQLFSASVSGTSNTGVTWSSTGGSVSSTGLYTAPSSAGTYTVTATSVADSTKSASATVIVSQPVAISISPTSSSLVSGAQQLFTAYITGTSNTAVTWSASGGTVSSAGLYTAPSLAGAYTVTAKSVADSTKSASASVSVSNPTPVSVSISPTTVSMPAGWQQTFTATVSGTSNTAVTWMVTSGTGTISSTGLYTAPSVAENDVVTAVSQADPTKSASSTVSVAAAHSVTLAWSPSSSSGVAYYNVYRGTVSGGPFTLLKSGVGTTSYLDGNVISGSTYYYVTTAVDSSGAESAYSNQAKAVIPIP
jgi:hypothetical protein